MRIMKKYRSPSPNHNYALRVTHYALQSQNGMTLIELLVITSLVVILSGTLLFNYRSAQDQFALQRSASKLAQDIRRVKAMAMSAQEFPPGTGDVPETGYGVVFDTNWDNKKYRLYADTVGNEFFQPADLVVETITLEEGVYIKEMYIGSKDYKKVSINFKPPDPEVKIKHSVGADEQEAKITLALKADPNETKTIRVNKLGLVTIE